MADAHHLEILHRGVGEWNDWRAQSPGMFPDLTGADLFRADLAAADLRGCYLSGAYLVEARLPQAYLDGSRMIGVQLMGAHMNRASLRGTDLSKSDLTCADLTETELDQAKLIQTNLTGARLDRASLTGADLRGAWLVMASLVLTDLSGADLTGCEVYGCSVWDATMDAETKQSDLVITRYGQSTLTIDDLQIAQFIYMLLNNRSIRSAIDTITSKVVLILGSFSPERKAVLDALRTELRERGYLPILFDFEAPDSRDLSETVSLLARMARFVIADLTDPSSIPDELAHIIRDLPSVPVQPLLQKEHEAYATFEHWERYPWVLPIYRYDLTKALIASLGKNVIEPAEEKVKEMRKPVRAR
jgi:uncharacterized protein YjbI with pentapeptide repeats